MASRNVNPAEAGPWQSDVQATTGDDRLDEQERLRALRGRLSHLDTGQFVDALVVTLEAAYPMSGGESDSRELLTALLDPSALNREDVGGGSRLAVSNLPEYRAEFGQRLLLDQVVQRPGGVQHG